LFKTEINLSI